VDDPLSPDKLFDLYKIALDEYRFEVRLGWDRTTYFLVLNSGILTVATGFLKLNNPPAVYLFFALLFLLGCGTSIVGSISTVRNHEYYRRTIDPETWVARKLRRSAITYWLRGILIALAVADVIGAVTSICMMIYGPVLHVAALYPN
jgi:hypothetical protein